MKSLIEQEYGLHVLGLIKVNEKVYKVKAQEGFYALKFCSSYLFYNNYYYIQTLKLNCFVTILLNAHQLPLTAYQNGYFYLMPWYEKDQVPMRELKLKFYFECLSWMHNHTFYNVKVSKDYYEKQIQEIKQIIQERKDYYLEHLQLCEKAFDRSPWQWMWLMNYYRIDQSFNFALEHLNHYQEVCQDKHYLRVALVYMNFNYQHIFLNQKKIISIDRMKIDSPIYDIFTMYQNSTDSLFDLDSLFQFYLQKIILQEQEKVLLMTLLSIVPVISIKGKNIDVIIQISRLLYYLDSIKHLIQQIDCH